MHLEAHQSALPPLPGRRSFVARCCEPRVYLPIGLVAVLAVVVGIVATTPRGAGRVAGLPVVNGGPGFPRWVEWPDGRRLEIAAPPGRLLLANAAVVDLVSRLVDADRVLALPEQALTWSRLATVDAGFRAKARFRKIDAELVAELGPDLVLCSAFNTALTSGELAANVLQLPMPNSLVELGDCITLLGRVLGAEVAAQKLSDELATRARGLRAGVGARAGLRAMFYTNLSGGWSAGSDTLQDEVIRLAGMINVIAELGVRGNRRVSFEEILATDPEVIFVPGEYGEAGGGSRRLLEAESVLRQVSAVRRKMIVELHPRLVSAASQEVLSAAEQLAAAVDRRLERRE